MNSGGVDSSKSGNSQLSNIESENEKFKLRNSHQRKRSVDNEASRSVGRSSNGTRNGSGDRVLKLKINKNKSKV